MYGERRGAYRIWVGNPKKRCQLEYVGIDLRIILTLRLLMYVYGAPSKARNANVLYIWTYVWQR